VHEQEQRLTAAINQERQIREREVRNLQQSIEAIHEDRHRLMNMAQDWLNDTTKLCDFINNQYIITFWLSRHF